MVVGGGGGPRGAPRPPASCARGALTGPPGRYGCTSKSAAMRLRERAFPYLLHNGSLMFNYDDCNFKVPLKPPTHPLSPFRLRVPLL